MVSDSYPHQMLFDDACLEVRSRLITRKANEDFGIGGKQHELLNQLQVRKKTCQLEMILLPKLILYQTSNLRKWHGKRNCGCSTSRVSILQFIVIPGYVKSLKEKLEADPSKKDRIPTFQKGATDLVKFIVSKFDEMQIFADNKQNMDNGFAYAYYKEQTDAGPTFLFFLDGLQEEKY